MFSSGVPVRFAPDEPSAGVKMSATISLAIGAMWERGTPSMFGKTPAALGLLLLLAGQEASLAASGRDVQLNVDPFLPHCKRSHETRAAIPSWKYDTSASLRHLMSSAPPGTARLVYVASAAYGQDADIQTSGDNYSTAARFSKDDANADQAQVWTFDYPHLANGTYFFTGFFAVAIGPSPKREITLRQLDTFDVVSSDRYCLGNGPAQAPPPATPAPERAQSGSLPMCGRSHESRIPIVTWKPTFSERDLRSAPPTGNGRIVYISVRASDQQCLEGDGLYSFDLPDNPADRLGAGGLEVNLRGNSIPVETGCQLEGFFMNEPVFGMHHGWVETYFGAIEKERIVASNRYCMIPQR
jgi:hypothetical protein